MYHINLLPTLLLLSYCLCHPTTTSPSGSYHQLPKTQSNTFSPRHSLIPQNLTLKMDDEDPLAGFAVADVSSDEGEGVEAAKSRRTGQSEEAWQAIRKEYSAKVENGDVRDPFTVFMYIH